MYNLPIVPGDFRIPERLETARIRLRPLVMEDVDRDYEAVMSSKERLQRVFRENGEWPEGLTREQNLIELAWHQCEFRMHTSFAYTVASLDESRILGCLYIYPTRKIGYDVEITMWVRESEAETGLDDHLYRTVRGWIASYWPFSSPAYPGRDIAWEAWNRIAEKSCRSLEE